MTITECCICRSYRDKNHKWYYPTIEERQEQYKEGKKISHTYCLPCMVISSIRDGYTESEIEEMVKSAEKVGVK